MIIDAYNYFFIIKELSEIFSNSKLAKIKVIDDYSLMLEFLTHFGIKKIIIDITIGNQCIFEIDKNNTINRKGTSERTKIFQSVLRKNIKNKILNKIELYNFDRCIILEFDPFRLIIEMFGNNSNVILIDSKSTIRTCLFSKISDKNQKFNGSDESFYNMNRHINIGKPYYFPRNNKKDPNYEFDLETINDYKGFGKSSRQLLASLNIKDLKLNSKPNPIILYKNKIPFSCFPFKVDQNHYEIENFENYKDLINKVYFSDYTELKRQEEINKIIKIFKNQKENILKRSKKYSDNDKLLKRANKFKKYADLLMSNIYLKDVFKNKDNITLLDYETEKEIVIPLDKGKDLQNTANNFYSKYKKLKKRIDINDEIMKDINSELQKIEYKINNPEEFLDLIDQKQNKKKTIKKYPGKIKSVIFEDKEIIIGGSAQDNDYILSHLVKGNELWLHAQNYKGAHVIIKEKKGNISPTLLKKAAQLAAKNSTGKNGGVVPVDYTEIKYVKKIKGIKGKVNFSNNKTIYIKL